MNDLMRKFYSLLLLLIASIACSPSYAGNPTVLVNTQLGDFEIELYQDAAPISVANFLNYVSHGYYNDVAFYRTVRMDNQQANEAKIQVIQGGLGQDSEGHFKQPLFKPIAHETTQYSGIKHTDGVISMARLEPGSASAEFFICIGDQPELDFGGQRAPDGQGFAAFGRVTRGIEVIRKIHQSETIQSDPNAHEYTGGQMLITPVIIGEMTQIKQ